MFGVLAQAGGGSEQDALQAVLDGVHQGNLGLAIVGVVVLIALLVLGVLKKDFPFVGPLAQTVLGLGRKLTAKKEAPAPPPEQQGAAAVVPIKPLDEEKK